jgi:hypothetical protein
MSDMHKKQSRPQAHMEDKVSGARKAARQRLLRPVIVLLSVIIVAVTAWIVLGPGDEGPPQPPATVNLQASNVPVSNDTNAGDPATGAPKIVFPETSYDFGAITQGVNVSHTFVVRNAGDAPLKLLEVGGS